MATKVNPNLSTEQYNICFLKGTEPPFSGKYTHKKDKGTYVCVNCGQTLFSSTTKFDSGTGWPSFYDLLDSKHVSLKPDETLGMERTEVTCSSCGAHLGHVFNDGPKPTGKRYCINSLSLDFKPDKSTS